MILSFGDKDAETIWNGEMSRRVAEEGQQVARQKAQDAE